MEFRTGSLLFPALRGGGPRIATQTVGFNRQVERAIAGLTGYSAGFRGSDHHFGELNLKVDTELDGSNVTVTGTLGVRDWSGNWDDDYAGLLQFAVLADLEPVTPPAATRQDLRIVGAELTQATQHFRSGQHLDPTNVRPDNSIRLVARKPTVVRVWVDYDATLRPPVITALSGSIEVTTSIGSTSFLVSPIRSIAPRREGQINRANVNHTLNFVIPEAWCQGELSLRIHVFDSAFPLQRSPSLQRTIRFVDNAPLRLYGVGIHYTGQGLDLAAPDATDFVSTMSFVERTYPVGEVELTGFSVIDFDRDMKADIDDGCGGGFNALLDRLRDMRGSSDDVYYGLLPSGIDSGSVGGCGGGGVGAGFIGGGSTAAQEIGHAFNRDHAPCDDENRCGNPSGQDGNYPKYDAFPSDSIGEYGYDTSSNSVQDPASTFDFMGYSGPTWVSPYTYEGLMSRFPNTSGSGSTSAAGMLRAAHRADGWIAGREGPAERIPREMMTLFLSIDVTRDRQVTRIPSFHYPTVTRRRPRRLSGITLELWDENEQLLSCQPLGSNCFHCSGDCWPKALRGEVPFPDGSRVVRVREGDDVIYEEAIPDPPRLEVEGGYDDEARQVRLRWRCAPPDGGAESERKEARRRSKREYEVGEGPECTYLVQFLDDHEVWRGVAPRTTDNEMTVPLALASGRGTLPLRVLATSGIATASVEVEIEVPRPGSEPGPTVVVLGLAGQPVDRPRLLDQALSVAVLDGYGRTVPDAEVIWFGNEGEEVGRGRMLSTLMLPAGQQLIRPAVLGGSGVGTMDAMLIERRSDGATTLHPSVSPEQEAVRDRHHHGQLDKHPDDYVEAH